MASIIQPNTHELQDVWMHIIGPMLDGVSIVCLSGVSKWAHHIAHQIPSHQGYLPLDASADTDHSNILHTWPHLKFEVKLIDFTSEQLPLMIGKFRVVSLFGCKIGSLDGINPQMIEGIGLYNTVLSFEAAESMARLFEQASRLTSVRLCYGTLNPDTLRTIAAPLQHLTNLTDLSLRVNVLDDAALACLCEPMRHLTKIKKLDLGCMMLPQLFASIAQLMSRMHDLTELKLDKTGLGDEEATMLAQSLYHVTNLTSLDLGSNFIRATGGLALAPAIAKLKNLSSLNLMSNQLGDSGALAIVCALDSKEDSLLEIIMGGNSLTEAGKAALRAQAKHATISVW